MPTLPPVFYVISSNGRIVVNATNGDVLSYEPIEGADPLPRIHHFDLEQWHASNPDFILNGREVDILDLSYLTIAREREERVYDATALTADQQHNALMAMQKYGGSFVCALSKAWIRADGNNAAKLRAAFSDLLRSYSEKHK